MRKMLLLLTIFIITALPALAHDPYIEDDDWGEYENPYAVADSAISYAFYGYLGEDDLDVFAIDFEEAGMRLQVELLVPECGEHYVDFHPEYAIISPQITDQGEFDLPIEIPEGYGVLHYESATIAERGTFLEPFGGTTFYEAPRLTLNVPEAGTYSVVLFTPPAQTGDYALAVGYEERFESPFGQMITNTARIRANDWLHRDCSLSPDDPNAIINVEHGHDEHKHDEHEHSHD